MIEALLPPQVAAAESFTDIFDESLFPEEEAVISRAVQKRRLEFTTGRACARRAMVKLGLPPQAILPGERREPIWPMSITGSITHCKGYRAAAVARVGEVRSIGIDAEPNQPLPSGILDRVSSPAERERLAKLTIDDSNVCWDRLLFCLKEATYKAWYPLAGRWLGFDDVDVTIDITSSTFDVRLLVPGLHVDDEKLSGFRGRFTMDNGLLLTVICV